jgi:hypothetical protein
MKLYKITCHITSNVARMEKPIKDLMRFYVIAGSKSDAKARAQTVTTDLIPIQFQRFNSPPFPTV